MTAFSNHFLFEFKTGLRNPGAMMVNYLLPLGFYAAMGFVMVEINPGYKELLIPSMIVFASMSSNILGLPNSHVEARDAGIYRSFKINGVPAISILSTPSLSTSIHAMLIAIVISLTATPLFDGVPPENWLALAIVTIITAFTFSTLGMLIGVASSSTRTVVLLSQLVYLPSILLGGMMIPIALMPESVQKFSGLIPSTYAMQAFFGLAYNQETVFNPWLSLAVLLVGGIFAFALAIYLFNWDSNNQTRRASPLLALLVLIPFVAGTLISFVI